MSAPTETKTLLEFIMDLLTDDDAREAFQQDPEKALRDAGLDGVCVGDIKELVPVVLERMAPEKAAHYEQNCDDDDDRGDRHRGDDDRSGHLGDRRWKSDDEGDHHHGRPAHHDTEIDKVITHLNFVTNNYSYDSHDTIFNTSNHTEIWAKDSIVTVDNDTTNTNNQADRGGVVVDGDNDGEIATGGSVAGDGNEVSGDGSTTAFGSGAATSLDHVTAADGGAISVGGPAAGNQADTDLESYGDGSTTTAAGQGGTASTLDSHDSTETTTNSNNHDSGNTETNTRVDSHDETDNSVNTDASTNDSGNVDASTNDSGNVDTRSFSEDDHSTTIVADDSIVTTQDPAFA